MQKALKWIESMWGISDEGQSLKNGYRVWILMKVFLSL